MKLRTVKFNWMTFLHEFLLFTEKFSQITSKEEDKRK